jgi:hypothetical protein
MSWYLMPENPQVFQGREFCWHCQVLQRWYGDAWGDRCYGLDDDMLTNVCFDRYLSAVKCV